MPPRITDTKPSTLPLLTNAAHNAMREIRHILLIIALLAGVVIIWLGLLDRPGSLSLRFQSHAVTPSVKQLIINDRRAMARASVTGRNENGPASYTHRFTDRMNYRVLWYDFVEEQAWQAEFSVRGRDLSTFGDRRDHATLNVTVGPGADVTVTTSNPVVTRLFGLKRQDELWDKDGNRIPEYDVLPILHKICAQPVPVDDPEVQFMIYRATSEFQYHIDDAIGARERVITRDGQPLSRCSP